MDKLFYYYIIEINTANNHIKYNSKDLFGDFSPPSSAVISSKEFIDYQDCVTAAANFLQSSLDLVRAEAIQEFKTFWVKNTFANLEEDQDIDGWLPNEAIKIVVMDIDGDMSDDDVLFKCRIFFKEQFHIFQAPTSMQ